MLFDTELNDRILDLSAAEEQKETDLGCHDELHICPGGSGRAARSIDTGDVTGTHAKLVMNHQVESCSWSAKAFL
jgi:hypothetical protein